MNGQRQALLGAAQCAVQSLRADAEREALLDKLAHCRSVHTDAWRGLNALGNRAGYGVADALHYAMDASRREARDLINQLRAMRAGV